MKEDATFILNSPVMTTVSVFQYFGSIIFLWKYLKWEEFKKKVSLKAYKTYNSQKNCDVQFLSVVIKIQELFFWKGNKILEFSVIIGIFFYKFFEERLLAKHVELTEEKLSSHVPRHYDKNNKILCREEQKKNAVDCIKGNI